MRRWGRYRRNGALFMIAVAITGLTACQTRAAHSDYEVGRSMNGNLVYSGILSQAGGDDLIGSLKAGDFVSVTSSGGDLKAGTAIAEAVNKINGYVTVGGSCYAECASSMAFSANRLVVPIGATLLFTKQSLRSSGSAVARRLISCIPEEVPENRYIWIAPSVMRAAGAQNVQFEWTVANSARNSFERLGAGAPVYWIDTC